MSMKDENREQLSALMDGELDGARGRQLIDRLLAEPELRALWARYHLLGGALERSRCQVDVEALPGRVRRALAAEPAPPEVRRLALPRAWLRPAAGLALAASVAAVAVIGLHLSRPGPAAPPPLASAPPAPEPRGMHWDVSRPGLEARLNGYLVTYSEYMGNGVRGMLPYARIVAYDGSD